MTDAHNILKGTSLLGIFHPTSSLPTFYRETGVDFYRFASTPGVISTDNKKRSVKTMMRYKKNEFNLDKALAGDWVAHPNARYDDYRLQVRIEDGHWHARIPNPDKSKITRRPYIDRSLRCKAGDLQLALDRATAFCREIVSPVEAGPTFNDILPDYIAAGCPGKLGKGQSYGPRAAKAQIVCAALLQRTALLIGDMPINSEMWEDVVQGIAGKVGGAVNFLKITGFLRALLGWAKRVKKLKVGELPSRAPDAMETRAGFESPAEVERLMRFAAALPGDKWVWLRLHMSFLRYVGCRPGDEIEVAAIRFREVADARSEDGWVEVEINKPKPGTDLRIAYADKELLDVMAAIRALHPTPLDPDALVFPAREYGRDFKELLTLLQEAEPNYPWLTDAGGKKRSLYSFRHFQASERAAQGKIWHVDNLSLHLGNTPEVCRHYYIKRNKGRIRSAMPKAA